MSTIDKLELQLNVWLNKKAPISVPSSNRIMLANALWWIALVVGILQLWSASALWHIGHIVSQVINYTSGLTTAYSATKISQNLSIFYWLSLCVLIGDAVLLLVASPHLKQMKKTGWNLLYYGVLLNAAYALFRLFSSVGGSFAGFISTAIATILAAYFLFQVRGYFEKEQSVQHVASRHDKRPVKSQA